MTPRDRDGSFTHTHGVMHLFPTGVKHVHCRVVWSLKNRTLLRLWEKRFRQHFFFCLIWNHAATCRKAKPGRVRPGRGIIGTTQGQGVYRRGRLRTGAFATPICRQLLHWHGMQPSMSRKGNCWDNAVAESFFHTLKTELIYTEDYDTHEAAQAAVFEYIEVFYNRQRCHSANGYLAPLVYEQALKTSEIFCPEKCWHIICRVMLNARIPNEIDGRAARSWVSNHALKMLM